jgi:hypothetical protein
MARIGRPNAWKVLQSESAARTFLGSQADVLAGRVSQVLGGVNQAEGEAAHKAMLDEVNTEVRATLHPRSLALEALRDEQTRNYERLDQLHRTASQTAKRLLSELRALVSAIEPIDRDVEALVLKEKSRRSFDRDRKDVMRKLAVFWFAKRAEHGVPASLPQLTDFRLLCELLEKFRRPDQPKRPKPKGRKPAAITIPQALAMQLAGISIAAQTEPSAFQLAAAEVVATGRRFPTQSSANSAVTRWENHLKKARPKVAAIVALLNPSRLDESEEFEADWTELFPGEPSEDFIRSYSMADWTEPGEPSEDFIRSFSMDPTKAISD